MLGVDSMHSNNVVGNLLTNTLVALLAAMISSCTPPLPKEANSDLVSSESMEKYDDADWHYGNDYPKHLPDVNAATHMGMFVAWAWSAGLAGEEFADDAQDLAQRKRTPGEYLFNELDEKFTSDLLNEEGNRFASAYYLSEKNPTFLTDYENAVSKAVNSLYEVPDSWQTFDLIKPILDKRLEYWRNPPKKGMLGFLKR